MNSGSAIIVTVETGAAGLDNFRLSATNGGDFNDFHENALDGLVEKGNSRKRRSPRPRMDSGSKTQTKAIRTSKGRSIGKTYVQTPAQPKKIATRLCFLPSETISFITGAGAADHGKTQFPRCAR